MSSNSTNIIPFNRPEPKTGFAQAREAWLRAWRAHPQVTQSDRAVLTELFLYFNVTQFKKTGELVCWPTWATLMKGTGLSETSIYRRLKHLERLGAFKTEHGRYDHKKKRRNNNVYRATNLARVQGTNLAPVQPYQPCTGARRLDDIDTEDSTNKYKNDSTNLDSVSQRQEYIFLKNLAKENSSLAAPSRTTATPSGGNKESLPPQEWVPKRLLVAAVGQQADAVRAFEAAKGIKFERAGHEPGSWWMERAQWAEVRDWWNGGCAS